MNETMREKKAMPESTHSRVNPPTNSRHTDTDTDRNNRFTAAESTATKHHDAQADF